MSALAWIVLGGVLALVALVAYFGWRVDQAAKAIAEVSNVVARVEKADRGH